MIDELFKKLVEIPSVSGSESLFQRLVAKNIADVSQSTGDILDNYTVQIGQGEQKVLITAHADEIGFIVTYIDDDGFIYFQPVGGVDADIAVGQVVSIQTRTGPIIGMIGRAETWDTASSETTDTITPFKELWIDIGQNEKAKDLVSVGDPVIFDVTYREMSGDYLLARGADDKLGVYILTKVVHAMAKKSNPHLSLFAVTMTQEEIGSRGAHTAVNKIQPKYSIIIDTIGATDTPITDKEEIGDIRLGAGPVLSRGSNTNPDLYVLLEEIAKREDISYQVEAEAGPTATDADAIQISGMGSATMVVSIPVRYTHFPGEVFSWEDVENCTKLIESFLHSLRESAS